MSAAPKPRVKIPKKAKAGDMTALRLCLDRIAPPRKDRPTSFPMPAIKSVQDHPSAIAAIIEAVSTGDLAPSEAEALCRMFGEHRKSVEIAELARQVKEKHPTLGFSGHLMALDGTVEDIAV